MWSRKRSVFLLILFSSVFLSAPAQSQTFEKGEITGTVYDPSGAVVPNASVKVVRVSTGEERALTTDSDGRYFAGILPAGEYRIEVSASGFATTIVKRVQLLVGQRRVQDVTVKIAAAGQAVEVTAEADTVDKGDRKSVV